MFASPRTHRTLGRTIAVHTLSAAFVLLALVAGAYLGAAVNRAPASASTTPPPATCTVLCDGEGGSGTVGTPGGHGLTIGGSGGSISGSGTVGANPGQ